MSKLHRISRVDAVRKWRYVCYFSDSGRVKYIKAGCRTWRSFKQAREHYWGCGPYMELKWVPGAGHWNNYVCSQTECRDAALNTLDLLNKRLKAGRKRHKTSKPTKKRKQS